MPYLVRLSCHLYARLLHLYPRDFRDEFADELLQCFTELSHDAWQQRRWRGLLSAWFWVGFDLLQSVVQQRCFVWRVTWRGIMSNQPYGKTLLMSTSIFVLTGIILFCYGSYNLVLHPSSYLRKPAVLFTWHGHETLEYATFVVSRAENSVEKMACETMPLAHFQTVPQTNLRSQYFSTSPDSILPAESHQIRDSDQINRSSSYCYHVAGVEADGSLTTLGFYHWGPYKQSGEFVFGNVVAVLASFLCLLLGVRLNSLTRYLPVRQSVI